MILTLAIVIRATDSYHVNYICHTQVSEVPNEPNRRASIIAQTMTKFISDNIGNGDTLISATPLLS